jgi:hypothetical protein
LALRELCGPEEIDVLWLCWLDDMQAPGYWFRRADGTHGTIQLLHSGEALRNDTTHLASFD